MEFWYRKTLPWFAYLLLPLTWLVSAITQRKRKQRREVGYAAPVLVVGNVTVGGTGKTPMIQYIAQLCTQQGIKVGIVSRGYGGKAHTYPLAVTNQTSPEECGDEPKLLNHSLSVPVVVSPDRHSAVQYLCQHYEVDIIISDDGLQHYNMARDIELVMVDGIRGLGNGYLLPAGPLRESAERLKNVDFIVTKGESHTPLNFNATAQLNLATPKNYLNQGLSTSEHIDLITAIGNGENFLQSITLLGYNIERSKFLADHAVIPDALLSTSKPIVITEKDAIKLDLSQYPNVFVAPLRFKLPATFDEQLLTLIREKVHEKSSHYTR